MATDVSFLVILVFDVHAAFDKSFQAMCVLIIIVPVDYEGDSSEQHHIGGMGAC